MSTKTIRKKFSTACLILVFVAGLLFLWAATVKAEQDTRWVRPALRSSCEYTGSCWRYRYDPWWDRYERVRVVHRRAPVRYYAPPRHRDETDWQRRDSRHERGVSCKAEHVRVVGGAHLTEKGAMNDAVRAWQSTVRYDSGEVYMELGNARDYRWRCDRASTNETLIGRAAENITGGDGFQRRCVIIAIPCRQPTRPGERD